MRSNSKRQEKLIPFQIRPEPISSIRDGQEEFRLTVNKYRKRANITQSFLEQELGLAKNNLSKIWGGLEGAVLTNQLVHKIISKLVEWQLISTRAEVRDLLSLVNCPDFPEAEWTKAPLAKLPKEPVYEVPYAVIPISPNPSDGQAYPPNNLPAPVTPLVGQAEALKNITGKLL